MIKDKLLNAGIYYPLSETVRKGLEWLKNTDLENIKTGSYTIDGKRVWANVQEYMTKPDAKYETHRNYIDIQYIIKGRELIGVSDVSDCSSCTEYDSGNDIEFFDCNIDEEYQELKEGQFLILYPHDAHKPSISPDKELKVKKVVVKAAIN